MPRAWSQTFQTGVLADLTRQLSFAPANQRVRQVQASEQLHDELELKTTYPFSFLVYRITGTRPIAQDQETLIVGKAAAHDLRLFIDRQSRTVEVPPPSEGVVTPRELAEEIGASVKTITRWRALGLRWRWMPTKPNAKHHVVICRSAVDVFKSREGIGKGEHAAKLIRLSDTDRDRIIGQAKLLAKSRTLSLNAVAQRIAFSEERSLETIRKVLQRHEQGHPKSRIFPGHRGPLSDRARRVIARAHRMGIDATAIAEHFGRATSTVYRVIHELEADALRQLTIDWVDISVFNRPDADDVILRKSFRPSLWVLGQPLETPPLGDLPDWLASVLSQPNLGEDACRSLLVRFNYLKRKASHQRDQLPVREPSKRTIKQIQSWLEEANQIHSLIFATHLPRLVMLAQRQANSSSAAGLPVMAWLAHGCVTLDEAVVSNNPARNQSFQDYMSNRVLQAYARHAASLTGSPVDSDISQVQKQLRDHLSQRGLMAQDATTDLPSHPHADEVPA